jgi:hypothetical protein
MLGHRFATGHSIEVTGNRTRTDNKALARIPGNRHTKKRGIHSHQVFIPYLECMQEVLQEMKDKQSLLGVRVLHHVGDKVVTQGPCDWRQLRKIALSKSRSQSKDSLTGERYDSGYRGVVQQPVCS